MSPAMVERWTPVVPSKSTDKAQTFTSLFDRPLIDSTSIRFMDDESNSFQFPPVSSSGKPSLSKARFFKVRKNAPHRKPSAAAAQEPAADPAFNPFRSEKNVVIPESGARVSESSNASFSTGAFVFGSGSLNLSRNLSVKSEGEPSLAQEAGMGRSFSFGSEGSGDSSSNLFVFGRGVQKNGDSSRDSSLGSDESLTFSKLMDDTMKSGVERGKQAENVFVFRGSDMDNRSMENAKPSIPSAFTSEGSVRPDAGNFVFGSGVRKSTDYSWDSPLGLNESKLAEETRKLNLNNPDDVGELEEMKKQAENVCVSGGSTGLNRLSESSASSGSSGSGSSDANVFEFGRGATKSADLSQNSSLGSEKGSFSLFADQMGKLNVDYFEKKQQAESAFSFGSSKHGSGISDGNNVNKLSDSARVASKPETTGLEKPAASLAGLGSNTAGEAGAFPFGSQVHKDDDFNAKLPDEMKKMNLSSGDDDGNAESADSDFAFGVNKSSTDSFKCVVPNKAAEEDAKLNVGNEAVGSAAGAFVFGSNTAKSSISSEATPSTSFCNRAASGLPNDKKSSSEDLDKDKEMGYKEKVDVGKDFAFGSSASAPASFVESAFSTLHDDLEKMKIGSETGKLAGNNPFKPAFQEGNLYNKGSIPSFGSTFTFLRKSGGLEPQHMEFKTPKQDTTRLTKESLFMGTDQSVPFSVKKCDAKGARAKKKRGKSKQPAPLQQNLPKHFIPVEQESQENREEGSPMDCSPYRDETVADQCSREPSVASVDSIHFSSCGSSVDMQRSVSIDERGEVQVSTAAEKLKINEGNLCQEEGDDTTNERVKRSSSDYSASADEHISRQVEEKDITTNENVDFDSNLRTGSAEAETGSFTSNIEGPASEGGTGFAFFTTFEDNGGTNFTFSASISAQDPLSASKHNYKRSSRSKSGQPVSTANARVRSASPLPDLIPPFDTSRLPDLAGLKSASSVAQSEDESKPGKCKESDVGQESTSSAAPGVAAREACEKWRFRGNQAYADGLLSKAEDYYTRGINSVSRREIPSSCIQPLTLCYSNRAATRMSLGRMREALSDCKMAVLIDPNFLKARLRIGNCLLALGEIGEASKQFKKCLQLEKDISINQKYISEATDGLQKAQQVGDLAGQATELLLKRTLNDASKAFNIISEALAICPHSESLMEMKAEALLVMRNYEEVIQVCERTLKLAEINSSMIEADSQDCSGFMKSSSAKVWRWHLIAKSYFYLGKLDEALELLEHEEMTVAVDRYMTGSAESSTAFADIIRELLRLKSAGNEAFQAGRHSEAVEYYTAALACNAESRPFSAVCLCNRAAAYQALGQITEAIADCSLAIALDASYPKAISRRATLHEMIRDYGHAANDLNRLISLLEKQVGEKFNQSGAGGKSTTNVTDLKRARARLAAVEEEARKGISLNMYMILGVEPTSSAADIKKAYRKAALRHHPDKAGQVIVRNENVDDGLWKEVAAEVQADADRLFKMIGEAYTILSDPKKRLEYDDEEEMRTTPRKSYGSSTPRTSSDGFTSYYEKNFNRRQWQARGSSYQQW